MKIVFAVEHFRPYVGGVEQLFGSLADALVAQGHEVVVVHRATDLIFTKLKYQEN